MKKTCMLVLVLALFVSLLALPTAAEAEYQLPNKFENEWVNWEYTDDPVGEFGSPQANYQTVVNLYAYCPLEIVGPSTSEPLYATCDGGSPTWIAENLVNDWLPANRPDESYSLDGSVWLIFEAIDEYVGKLTPDQKSDTKVAQKIAYIEFLRAKTAEFVSVAYNQDLVTCGADVLPGIVTYAFESLKLAVTNIGTTEYDDPYGLEELPYEEPPADQDERVIPDPVEEDESKMIGIPHIQIENNNRLVLRDEPIVENGVDVLTASLARYEYEGMQFIVHFKKDIHNLKVTVSDLVNEGGEKLAYTLYRQQYIEIHNGFLKTISSRGENGWYPDAMVPMYDGSDGLVANNVCDVVRYQNQGYWITVFADEEQTPGIYTGTVTVSCDEHDDITIPVEIEVWNFNVPVTPSCKTMFFGSWYPGYYSDQGMNQAQFMQMMWDFTTKYRINPGEGVPQYLYASDTMEYVSAMVDFLKQPTTTMVRIQPGMVTDKLVTMLKRRGLLDKICVYYVDEPGENEETLKRLADTCAQTDQYGVKINNLVTTGSLYYKDYVNIWCPRVDYTSESLVRERIAAGDTYFWYCCDNPTYPYPNYHLNNVLLTPRVLHWMQRDYGIQGELMWNIMNITRRGAEKNIWVSSNTHSRNAQEAFLLYPGKIGDGIVEHNELVPTLRLESMRDGFEDYEYLTLMENKLQALIDKLGLDVVSDSLMNTYYNPLYLAMNNFNLDDTVMQKVRLELAHDIMASDDVFVDVAAAQDGSKTRVITVYAPAGASVALDGQALTETAKDGYSVYTASVAVPYDEKIVTVTVNGEDYERVLGSFDYDARENTAAFVASGAAEETPLAVTVDENGSKTVYVRKEYQNFEKVVCGEKELVAGEDYTVSVDSLFVEGYADHYSGSYFGTLVTLNGSAFEEAGTYPVTLVYNDGAAKVNVTVTHEHRPTPVDGKAATEEEDGFKGYYACECGQFFEDAEGKTEIADLAAWKEGAGKIDRLPHTHKLTPVASKTPTETENGFKGYYACECGQFFEDAEGKTEIADLAAWKEGAGKLVYEQNPRTEAFAIGALSLTSLVTLAGAVICKRKK